MSALTSRLRRPLLSALAAVALWCLALPGVAAAWCGDDLSATLWSLNALRSRQGVTPLRLDTRLSRAAVRHSRDMVHRRYFAHESITGAPFSSRIAATGWMRGRGRWSVGETLAWGLGESATPESIIAAWLRSPSHRRGPPRPPHPRGRGGRLRRKPGARPPPPP